MKKVLLLFMILSCVSCLKDEEEEGAKQTGYKEYTMTVASEKLIGIKGLSTYFISDVYAVKTGNATSWSSFESSPKGFEYESGYEYLIKIAETNWIDYSRGDPAWTEYELKEIISKTKKESEGLPKHFIPDWFVPQNKIRILYGIEAENKEIIENNLKSDISIPWNCKIMSTNNCYALWNNENKIIDYGSVRGVSKEPTLFPEVYKTLPPDVQIKGCGELFFTSNTKDNERHYDTFYTSFYGSPYPNKTLVYLYKDFTEYYKQKYPEAMVKAVVVSFIFTLGNVINE